jgi:hypothetical protein
MLDNLAPATKHLGASTMSLILTIKAFAVGIDGLTLFVETPWFDASIGPKGPDLLIH